MAMNMTSLRTQLKFTTPLMRTLREYWSWWIEELGGMLPKNVRAAILPSVERLYIAVNNKELVARQGTREATHEIGRYPLPEDSTTLPPEQAQELEELAERSREVVLCLPSNKLLTKTLTLPLAAEENLRQVLAFEMDRQTPFTAEQVYFDYTVTAREPKNSTLTLDLVLTPRAFLNELLSKLDSLGLQPHQATICTELAGGQSQSVNLLPAEARRRRPDTARYLNLALGVIALMLLLGVIALPLMNKTQVINDLDARMELIKDKAEVTRRLREKVEQLGTDASFLANKKQATPLTLELIDELTRLLPDDTWIERLDIKGQEVLVQGQSASAAALIPVIESSDRLGNARFRSPVTRLPRTNTERFHLSAEIETETES